MGRERSGGDDGFKQNKKTPRYIKHTRIRIRTHTHPYPSSCCETTFISSRVSPLSGNKMDSRCLVYATPSHDVELAMLGFGSVLLRARFFSFSLFPRSPFLHAFIRRRKHAWQCHCHHYLVFFFFFQPRRARRDRSRVSGSEYKEHHRTKYAHEPPHKKNIMCTTVFCSCFPSVVRACV